MLDFEFKCDKNDNKKSLKTSLSGKSLLNSAQLNKGTAFTAKERKLFGLEGKLPHNIENLSEQVTRCYQQYCGLASRMAKFIYLNNLHDINQTLFYKLVSENLDEMLPNLYTPMVGTAVEQFSHNYRRSRGIYLDYPSRERIEEILDNRSNPDIDLIVVTDSEAVLGIGDQGVGGIDIPIAKLMVYSLVGGINPCRTLPIVLDLGTNNQKMLNDPFYLGWRHKRLERQEYDDFIADFVAVVKKKFPNVFLHWEDFGGINAHRIIHQYRDKLCNFNDDIQGTAVATMAGLMSATKALRQPLDKHRIVIFGAGAAGLGIAAQIEFALQKHGLTPEESRERLFLIDRPGLLHENLNNLTDIQQNYARPESEVKSWGLDGEVSLLDTIKNAKPTILIGCSGVTGAFTEEVITTMADNCPRPIILPLSNPTSRCEAHPKDIFEWCKGQCLVATGSPFGKIQYQDRDVTIAQNNNALVFPGLGLGVIAARATKVTDNMLWAACKMLSEFSPILQNPDAPLLPPITEAKQASQSIAFAVASQAIEDGVAGYTDLDSLQAHIAQLSWQPQYIPYELKSESK